MGSGNSSPVEHAEVVETEAHQDMIEVRFDHLAFGGTAAVILILILVIFMMHIIYIYYPYVFVDHSTLLAFSPHF